MRVSVIATIATSFLAIFSPLTTPVADAAVLAGVGLPTTDLQLYYDAANINSYSRSGTVVNDLSGNSNYGNFYSTPAHTTASTGSYFTFPGGAPYGSNTSGYQYIKTNNFNPDFNRGGANTGITIAFFGNFGTVDSYERIIDFGNGSQADNIIFARDWTTGNIYYETYNGATGKGRCTSNAVIDGTNQQYTVVVSSTGCKIFLNGNTSTPVASSDLNLVPINTTNARSKMYIGRSNWDDQYFSGLIYRLAIYNRPLSNSEVSSIYNSMTDTSWVAVSGSGTYSVNENMTAVATLSSSPNEVATYLEDSTRGDFNKFSITSSGVLSLDSAQNFEAIAPSTTFVFYLYITDANGNSQIQVITINIVDVVESTSLSAPTLSATPYKGLAVTITVTPSGDGTSIPGKVSYLLSGKRISACFKKTYSGTGNSTCIFEPSIQGNREISVTFTPTNTNFTAVTSKKNFFIYKRTTNR